MMVRYIEAVKTADIISEKLNIPLGDLVDVFAEIPTANVEEVRHGKFIKRTPCSEAECDQCGNSSKLIFGILPSYCPHCGAKMGGPKKQKNDFKV